MSLDTAFAMNYENGKWYNFDDSHVSETDSSHVVVSYMHEFSPYMVLSTHKSNGFTSVALLTHACSCLHMHTYSHMDARVHTCIHAHARTHIHAHTYTHTHTHTHTRTYTIAFYVIHISLAYFLSVHLALFPADECCLHTILQKKGHQISEKVIEHGPEW